MKSFVPKARLYAAVSGSFRRHLGAIQEAVQSLSEVGAVVLSPGDPRIVDAFGEFVFVSSDLRRSIKGVQNRHLDAIRHSDFLWLVCPDGYVGQSAAMELGFATASGVPVFADVAPSDWTLRQYVTPVGNVRAACLAVRNMPTGPTGPRSLLLDPEPTIAALRREVDGVERVLLADRHYRAGDPVEQSVRRIGSLLTLPGSR